MTGSLFKTNTSKKLFGQVYTPRFIVQKMLDDIGYRGKEILGKKIVDPACGNGRFLEEVVKRILIYSPPREIIYNLSQVYGWDIDRASVDHCIQNLSHLLLKYAPFLRNAPFVWNITEADALHKIEPKEQLLEQFHFIVGNPPYIRVQNLKQEQREYLQHHYSFCQNGSTDTYIAFFELCYKLLQSKGICALITPNTYIFTAASRIMRDFFLQSSCTKVKQITNYGNIQLFEGAITYSAITIFHKKNQKKLQYEQAVHLRSFKRRQIPVKELAGKPLWRLSADKCASNSTKKGQRLGDICHIHAGLTTLCDRAYIFSKIQLRGSYAWVWSKLLGKWIKLEQSILKPIIKASKVQTSKDKIKEYILFPYRQIQGKNQLITEKELQYHYPNTYTYLHAIKQVLDARDKGKPNKLAWYAFGRNQGLDTSFGKKILFSYMHKKPKFVLCETEKSTFYSGYCIKYQGDYQKLLLQLNSERMEKFISVSSRDFRGGWKAYNKKTLQNFMIYTP